MKDKRRTKKKRGGVAPRRMEIPPPVLHDTMDVVMATLNANMENMGDISMQGRWVRDDYEVEGDICKMRVSAENNEINMGVLNYFKEIPDETTGYINWILNDIEHYAHRGQMQIGNLSVEEVVVEEEEVLKTIIRFRFIPIGRLLEGMRRDETRRRNRRNRSRSRSRSRQ